MPFAVAQLRNANAVNEPRPLYLQRSVNVVRGQASSVKLDRALAPRLRGDDTAGDVR